MQFRIEGVSWTGVTGHVPHHYNNTILLGPICNYQGITFIDNPRGSCSCILKVWCSNLSSIKHSTTGKFRCFWGLVLLSDQIPPQAWNYVIQSTVWYLTRTMLRKRTQKTQCRRSWTEAGGLCWCAGRSLDSFCVSVLACIIHSQ